MCIPYTCIIYINYVCLINHDFRFAVKLSLDQLLLGPFDSHEELCQELVECDRNWYIGSERDIQWAEAIMANKKQLFSLSFDNNQVFRLSELAFTKMWIVFFFPDFNRTLCC